MLQLETIERVARVTPTISALLAGFSFTMVRGLMFHSEKPGLTNAGCFPSSRARRRCWW